MMFQASPVDLASQFSALALKGGSGLPDHYNPLGQLQNGHNPGKEDAGHALLKLLQSGSSKPANSVAQGQPHQQPGAGGQAGLRTAQQSLPELPMSFLNGPSLSQPAVEELSAGAGNALFGAPVSSSSGAPHDTVTPQQALPSLFVGNSIWSTSSTDAAGATSSSLWGGSSIWSSQAEGWAAVQQQQQQQQQGLTGPQELPAAQQQAQQHAYAAPHSLAPQQPLGPHSGGTLAPGSVGSSSRASSAPLVSPRHSLQHQHQQQFGQPHVHPHQQFGQAGPHLHVPVQQQYNGQYPHQPPHQHIPPSSTGLALHARQQHQQHLQPHTQQPYQQQQVGAFPPQHPAYPPPHSHGQYQPGALGMGVDSRQHQGHHQQAPPFPGPGHRSLPADLGMPFGQPGGGLGPLPGLAGLRVPPPGPPPPPPAVGGHAPKFAPPAGLQGFAPPLDDRLKPPLLAGQVNGVASARPGQFAAPPKVMRHQQLKQPPGFPNHFSPKHGASSGSRWVEVGDRAPSGRLPRGDLAVLEAKLLALVETLKPTPDEQERQRAAFQRVREVLQQRWPHARVHLFGSVANGLSVRSNNDLDVCLEMEDVADDQGAKGEVATELGEVLREAGMKEVLPLPKARVPVVKFVVPDTGTKVDVTVNNILACINTKLLADYAAVDPRLAQLVAVVKHWAKQRAVNDSYRGTLSSYCYVLMCIHLLQTRSPPVLPSLQQMPPTFHRGVGQWECRFFDQVDSLRDFGSDNTEPLAQLVWSFFEYWAWRHDYSADVISVRTGGFLRKEDKDWTRRIGNERHLVCIEDPFELSHDLGRTVDRQTKSVLHKEFIRAATLLRDAPDPMEKLFEPYRVGRA